MREPLEINAELNVPRPVEAERFGQRRTSAGLACSPSRIVAGSPGIRCRNTKLATVIANSTSTSRTRRSTTNRATREWRAAKTGGLHVEIQPLRPGEVVAVVLQQRGEFRRTGQLLEQHVEPGRTSLQEGHQLVAVMQAAVERVSWSAVRRAGPRSSPSAASNDCLSREAAARSRFVDALAGRRVDQSGGGPAHHDVTGGDARPGSAAVEQIALLAHGVVAAREETLAAPVGTKSSSSCAQLGAVHFRPGCPSPIAR